MASHVYVKNPNGTTYVYENISYWDKKEKRTKHHRKCIGKVDPSTKQIIPTGKNTDIRPDDTLQKHGCCSVLTIGPAMLLDKAAEQTKLTRTLRLIFRKIMSRSSCVHATLQAKGKHSATQNNGPRVTDIRTEKII